MIDILAAKHKTMFCRGRRGKVDTSELVPELRPLKPVSYSMDFPESPCCSFEESQEWASDDRGSSSSNVNDASQNYQEVLHRCPWCLALFNDADKLKEHELCHGPFICTVCGESFPTSGAYQSHVKTHVQSKPRVRPFRCEQCGKTFTAKSSLKTHQVTHTGEQPFGCTVCGKRFSLLCNLKTHERIHRGERPFKCMECGRSFTQKHVLKRHVCV
ncbi:gastrula zinc finger protein XlCGF7.1-like [Chanos chanos]|uniref:Gastrula zinc finger protein XlCGF7.1-like n=1 Tax=Chanos chanos TaxID=29144 RepID=A0A6J2WI29_CHACN|nr:gastrula zinc finger protein XlCGF7.1-like [Chanos chanos]